MSLQRLELACRARDTGRLPRFRSNISRLARRTGRTAALWRLLSGGTRSAITRCQGAGECACRAKRATVGTCLREGAGPTFETSGSALEGHKKTWRTGSTLAGARRSSGSARGTIRTFDGGLARGLGARWAQGAGNRPGTGGEGTGLTRQACCLAGKGAEVPGAARLALGFPRQRGGSA